MSRPLHRGLSGGGRFSGGGGRDPFDQNYKAKGDNGFVHELLSPMGAVARSRQSLTIFLLRLGLALVVALGLSGSLYWTVSISISSRVNIYRGYRRLQQQLITDLAEIGEMSLGISKLKELEFCPLEYENYVPCYYNVSENPDSVDLDSPIEYDRQCVGSSMNCLILPPKNYRIPLRWPTRRDFIWKENVKITGHEFSSGSLTKRMMVEEEQISFHSDSLMVDGVEDYSHQIVEMIGLRNEPNFNKAGALVFLLALKVRAANRPAEYDSDDEYIAPRSSVRQPLINRQGVPATGVPPILGTLDQRPSRNDAWSQRMREKYGLDTSEFTYNPSDPNRYQQAAAPTAEEKSRCTIL